MNQQDPTETQHFAPPTVDEVLDMLRKILSPIYGQVLEDDRNTLLAEIHRLNGEVQRLKAQMSARIR